MMAPDEVVDFSWDVPQEGFQWVEGYDARHGIRGRWLAVAAPLGADGLVRRYRPLEREPALFRTFADMPLTEEAILHFANQYGGLGLVERIRIVGAEESHEIHQRGESFVRWRDEIRDMRLAVMLWDAFEQRDVAAIGQCLRVQPPGERLGRLIYCDENDPDGVWHSRLDGSASLPIHPSLAQYVGEGDLLHAACFFVQALINLALEGRVDPRLLYDAKGDRLHLLIVPKDLLGAMWLQMARSVEGHKTYRRCRECGTWFELDPDRNRTSKFFCANACRSKAYRGRQALARRLSAEGVPVDEIAQRLGTDLATAQGWVAQTPATPQSARRRGKP
jgi:hypothetical protein